MDPSRVRARDLGLVPGQLPTGPANAISDVPGIRVGHATLVAGADIRTGVTAIVHDGLLSGASALPAGLAVFNGFGKMVGSTQLAELGTLETPVLLTATLSVFRVADALLSYLHELHLGNRHRGHAPRTLNPVVAETNDGYLSDIWARPIAADHVRMALDTAADGPVAEGCVGAGTGTAALGFKAGIGTSSRVVPWATGPVTLGALVQVNFGGELTVLGTPIPAAEALAAAGIARRRSRASRGRRRAEPPRRSRVSEGRGGQIPPTDREFVRDRARHQCRTGLPSARAGRQARVRRNGTHRQFSIRCSWPLPREDSAATSVTLCRWTTSGRACASGQRATANSQRQISRPQWALTRNVPSGPNGMRAHTAWVKPSGSGIAWALMLAT